MKKWISFPFSPRITDDEITQLLSETPLKYEENKEDIKSFLEKIIHQTFSYLKKTNFNKQDADYFLDNYFWRLSIRELLSLGHTFYMNSCIDYTLVTLEFLRRAGFKNINFVLQELRTPGWFVKLHFWLEIRENCTLYNIDYKQKNEVIIGKWKFNSDYQDKREQVVYTQAVPSSKISLDDNLETLIQKDIINLHMFIPGSEKYLSEKLKQDNTQEKTRRLICI